MYQSKAFDSTNKGWLILIVKLAILISFVGKLKRKLAARASLALLWCFQKFSRAYLSPDTMLLRL